MARFDPENPKHLAKLRQSIIWSERRLRERRRQRIDQLRQLVGFHYGEFGAADKVPINMIELGVNIYNQAIAIDNPAAMVATETRDYLPSAYDTELAVNKKMNLMDLASSMNACGQESLFSCGVMKIGWKPSSSPAGDDGYTADPGDIYADPVLFEDLILDMTAKRWEHQQYLGDRFRPSIQWVRENENYDKKVREQIIQPSIRDMQNVNKGGPEIRSETLSQGDMPIMDEFRDHVDLISLWLPFEGLILTLHDGSELPPLRIVEWDGPKNGPYRRCALADVPGNLIPLAPVPLWVDLHEIVNILFRKAADQAERQKTLLLVQQHATEAGKVVVEADDGDAISTPDPRAAVEMSTGGANQTTLAMVMWCKQMLAYMGGNWDAIGGLAPQSQTLGQDKMLIEAASGRLKQMQKRYLKFASEVIGDIAWWMWRDPLSSYKIQKPIEGTQFSIDSTWSPETRKGEWEDYDFTINPYSRQAKTPESQANKVMQFFQTVIVPAMPIMAQQGIGVNWEAFFKLSAKYHDMPELNQILTYAQGEQLSQQGRPDQPGMAANTTRQYVRQNQPGASQQGQEQVMMRQLLGGDSQGSEMASLLRPTG